MKVRVGHLGPCADPAVYVYWDIGYAFLSVKPSHPVLNDYQNVCPLLHSNLRKSLIVRWRGNHHLVIPVRGLAVERLFAIARRRTCRNDGAGVLENPDWPVFYNSVVAIRETLEHPVLYDQCEQSRLRHRFVPGAVRAFWIWCLPVSSRLIRGRYYYKFFEYIVFAKISHLLPFAWKKLISLLIKGSVGTQDPSENSNALAHLEQMYFPFRVNPKSSVLIPELSMTRRPQ